jgi:hypothetical protein
MQKMTVEKAMEALKEYKCFFCGAPADRIGFFAKLYQHSGKSTKENPTLFCESCWSDPLKREQISNVRGGIEGVFCHLFSDLGKMTESEIGKITSRVRYEINHLSSRIWRRQVYQIHYLSIPPKKFVECDNHKQAEEIRIQPQ